MLKKVVVIALIISSIFIVHDAFNNSAQPNVGYSGAPGEQTCAASGCHAGVPQVGSSQLGFRVQSPPNTSRYTVNTVYTLLVNFPFGNVAEAGFIVTALDDNNNNAGRLENISANSNTDTLTDVNTGRKYIGHKNANSTIAWAFRWRAPSNYVGKVTFYCAALGADNNTLATNDITYLDTIQLLPFGSSNTLDANFTIPASACVNQVITANNSSTGTITSYSWDFGAGATPPTANTAGPHNIAYSSPGTKTIKLVISDGTIVDSISKTITINGIPTANAGNDPTICSGQSATLTATGGTTYTWSNQATSASINVTPNATTTYTVTATQNGCTDTDEVTVTVNPTPVVSLSNANFCAGNSVTLNAGNAGATFLWSNNATTQTITVNTPNTYSVTVTRNNCSATASAVVTQLSSLNIGLPPTASFCTGQNTTLDAGNPGATYLWSNNATTKTITVNTSGTFSVLVTDANGCTGRDTTVVTVNANPTVSISNINICNGQNTTLDAGNAGATFLWSTQATSQSIVVSPASNTNYAVTVTNSNGCSSTDNALVSVSGVNATDAVVCLGQPATLTATGASSYSWNTGETTASIQVTVNDTAFYIVTGTGVGSCNAVDTAFVFPVAAITPVFQLPDTFCSNENNIQLENFVNLTGGTFSGIGVNNNVLDASSVNPGGPFIITYDYSNLPGCTTQVSEQFSVIVAATVALNGLSAEYCVNDNIVTLQGIPSGGSFTGNAVVDNLFIPYFAEAGQHIINYEYEAANGCVSIASDTIVIHDIPQIIFFMNETVFCDNEDAVVLTGIPTGGTFSGTGIEQDTLFNPTIAGAGGPYALQYQYTDSNGCSAFATNTVAVNNAATISFSGIANTYCINNGFIDLNALPEGGVFTGEAVSNNQLNTTVAGLGNDTITYVYISAENCVSSLSTVIAIVDTPQVSFTGLANAYCNNEVAVTLNGIPEGGVFSGTGISDNIFNPAEAVVGGPFSITYTYADGNGCENAQEQLVFINEAASINISLADSIFCSNDEATYVVTLFPESGVLSGAGINGNSFNASLAGEGIHILRYEFLSANGCFSVKDIRVKVNNCNSVEDINLGKAFMVYPNPANNQISIEIQNSEHKIQSVSLYDVAGKNIHRQQCKDNISKESIDVSILEKGMYFTEVLLSNGEIVRVKFLKE